MSRQPRLLTTKRGPVLGTEHSAAAIATTMPMEATVSSSLSSSPISSPSPSLMSSVSDELDERVQQFLRSPSESLRSSNQRKSVTFSFENTDPSRISPSRLRKDKKPILKKEIKRRESLMQLLKRASEILVKELRGMVEERDRIISALKYVNAEYLLPGLAAEEREELLGQKGQLDESITDVHDKLRQLPLEGEVADWVFSAESKQLTLTSKRRYFMRRASSFLLCGSKSSAKEEDTLMRTAKIVERRPKDGSDEDDGTDFMTTFIRISKRFHDEAPLSQNSSPSK